MPFRARDICGASMEFACAHRLLKTYRKSGRYTPGPRFRTTHAVDDEIKMVAWYSRCEGPLYDDPCEWGKAFKLISGFTKHRSMDRRWWKLPRLYGPINNVTPPDVLHQLNSAFVRSGLHSVDRNDLSFSAAFTSAESCSVMDLPEPYGKWYQVRNLKPRWKQEVDLEIDIHCQVFSEDVKAGPGGAFASFVDVEVSSLAGPLFIEIGNDLARLLRLDNVAGSGHVDDLQRKIATSMRTELETL